MTVAYVTAAESDVYLAAFADWLALDDATKDNHLIWGRLHIDSKYLCEGYDENNATDDIKHANSIAGYESFKGNLFADSPFVDSVSVTAGSVSSSTTYSSGYKETSQSETQMGLLLGNDCSLINNNSGTVGLSRN